MSISHKVRKLLIRASGYWIYKTKYLPVGADLFVDIKNKNGVQLKTIFDVGANTGQSAIKYSQEFPEAKIFSFEPVKATYNELVKNTGNLKGVNCLNFAFGKEKGSMEVKLFAGEESYLNSLNMQAMNQSDSAASERININTIDGFLNEQRQIESVDLLKIDTEGYEINVLQGAEASIRANRIKLIYLEVGFSKKNPRNSYFPEVQNYLESVGFTFFGLYEIAHLGIKSDYHYGNALYVHSSVLKFIHG